MRRSTKIFLSIAGLSALTAIAFFSSNRHSTFESMSATRLQRELVDSKRGAYVSEIYVVNQSVDDVKSVVSSSRIVNGYFEQYSSFSGAQEWTRGDEEITLRAGKAIWVEYDALLPDRADATQWTTIIHVRPATLVDRALLAVGMLRRSEAPPTSRSGEFLVLPIPDGGTWNLSYRR